MANAVVRVLYRSLLRAAVRVERHWQSPSERAGGDGRGGIWAAAGETAAGIAARAQGMRPLPLGARALKHTTPRDLIRHAFRGTLPTEANFGRITVATPNILADDRGAVALEPAFEALRLATALAADLELAEALCKLVDEDHESTPVELIERGMWLISARCQAAQIDRDDGSMSVVEQQLDKMVSTARREHDRLAVQCTDNDCPFLWVEALNHAVFAVGGFRANASDYYSPSNSIISEVLQQRTGLPITCGIVYMMVAHRLGLVGMVQPTNFPFHFLLRLELASPEQCSCVAASHNDCSPRNVSCGEVTEAGEAPAVANTEPTLSESQWDYVAGLWVSLDPETGPELFRLQWAPLPPTSSNAEDKAPSSGRASTRWLIGRRITHGRMDVSAGSKAPLASVPPSLHDGGGGYRRDDGSDTSADRIGSPPYPPRVRWFKVALPLSAAADRRAAITSSPGVMVLSASLPDGEEGLDEQEGEFEARLSCRVEVHAADKQALGQIGRGEAVSPGVGRRLLEVSKSEAHQRTAYVGSEKDDGTQSVSTRPNPSPVLQLRQVSAVDQFFIDPFCAGQLLPDWYLLHQTLASDSAPSRAELLPLLGPASPRTVLSRALRNLAMAHSQQPSGGDEAHAWSRLADSLKGHGKPL